MKFASVSAIAALILTGCSGSNVDTQEAVRQGIIKDIAKNVNVGAMDVNVLSVRFRDKEADAVVSFAPKGGNAAQGLTMNYTMERTGNDWHIKSRAQGDVQKHAAQGQAQAGQMDGAPGMQGDTQLPPGHPPMNGSAKQ